MNNRVAIYLRLSREDGSNESQSIVTQREILMSYVNKQGWEVYKEYVDDGYSGTNFNRPGFNQLLIDIEVGQIDILLTKDLSRLGRNYLQVGYYTEEFFPNHNVRYIALMDNYDSDKEDGDDFAPFRNVINEWYAKDTSKKIRSILNNKAASGEPRNTVFPIFGYAYNDKFERVPDSETAPIVQLIFKKFIEFGTISKVVEYLAENKIKTPRYYNALKFNYNKNKVFGNNDEQSFYKWSHSTIHDIIVKEEYLGVYKTAQSRTVSFKNKKRHKNNGYVFENRYEPLVDVDTWRTANRIIKHSAGSKIPLTENVFRGLIYCSDCGSQMRLERRTLPDGAMSFRYYCANKKCKFTNSVTKKMLETICIGEIKALRNYILSKEEELFELLCNYDYISRELNVDLNGDLEKANKKLEETNEKIGKFFEMSYQGLVPDSLFNVVLDKYTREVRAIESQIDDLKERLTSKIIKINKDEMANKLIDVLREIKEEEMLEPYILHRIIQKITIKTTFKNNYVKKRNIEATVTYFGGDELFNGFLTYDE